MSGVSIEKLNKRQLSNLVNKNKKWKAEGLVPNCKILYHHCNRCVEFSLGPKYKPVSAFSLHGSKADGCSTYCTNCTNTRLNKEETKLALDLMVCHGVCADEGVILLRDKNNNWVKATTFDKPSEILKINSLTESLLITSNQKTSFKGVFGILGCVLLLLGFLWTLS